MSFTPEPVRCRPAAYAMFAAQAPRIETSQSLIDGAVAISMHLLPQVDPADVNARLQELADRVRSRLHSARVQAILAHAHEVLFDEEGFVGNSEDYFNPHNSYLSSVLETRTGIPVTLSLVYKSVVERLGLRAFGVNAPGHFLVAVDAPHESEPMLVDTYFGGRIMSPDEAMSRAQEVLGRPVESSAEVLTPATNRQWLGRILANLHHVFAQTQRYEDMAAMSEMSRLLEDG